MSGKIDMQLVRQLRDMTGLGFGDCKDALVQTESNLEEAVLMLRKASGIKADKKAGRAMTEGLVATLVNDDNNEGIIIQVSCETDFVARSDDFQKFLTDIYTIFMNSGQDALDTADAAIESLRAGLVQKLGENVQVTRGERLRGSFVADYVHSNGKIGVLTALAKPDAALTRDIAMHIAAESPLVVRQDELPAESLAAEKAIYEAQAADSGKPAEVQAKMVEGRMRKYAAALTLLDQEFVKSSDQKVSEVLKAAGNDAEAFVRLSVSD